MSSPPVQASVPAPLRRRPFGLVWIAGLVSETGDWLLLTGLPIYVFLLTGSSLVTSTVFICELIPNVLLGSVTGVVVDRWDRRRLLIAVSIGQSVLLLPLLAAHSHDRLWVVYVVAVGEAVLTQFAEPAKNALLPALVAPDELVRANSLVALNSNLGRLVGSSLGGFAVAAGSLTGAALGDAASFLVVAVLIGAAGIAPSGRPAHRRIAAIRQWRDGIALVTRSRELRFGFVSALMAGIAQGLFVVLFVVFATSALHADGTEIGLLRGVQAIGGMLGGLLVGALSARIAVGRLVAGGAFAFGVLGLITWNAPLLTVAEGLYVGLFIAVGIPGMAYITGLTSLLQRQVPADHLGRAFGAFNMVNGGAQAIGMLLAGVLGGVADVVTVLNGQALLYLLAGVVALPLVRQQHREPVEHPL